MEVTKGISSILLLSVFCWILNTRLGKIPPIGKLINPATGFWINAEANKKSADIIVNNNDVLRDIVIKFDENRIPHIFSENDHDMYFAQGYLTAKDRLWQMDIQVRTASGNLSSLLGNELSGRDMFYRRIGLKQIAEKSLDSLQKDPLMKNMLQAYSDGVNAYIKDLRKADYPIEYKLFDEHPHEWTPLSSLLVLKLLTQKLSGGEKEFAMANAVRKFGINAVKDLYNYCPVFDEPVVPTKTPWKFKSIITNPVNLDSIKQENISVSRYRPLDIKPDGIGSNNWAVAGSKTASGYPILVNDPHLSLSLPSVWYQIQLSNSGDCNVYGVSIPGLPGVIIGYNEFAAWGMTNAEVDMVDWYKIKFKDQTKSEYFYNNKWNKTTKNIESIELDNGEKLYDTIYYTHHGPVVYDGTSSTNNYFNLKLNSSEGFAMHWVMQDAFFELKTFYLLNRTKNYEEYRQALALYRCPAQNFVFACVDKEIAMTSNGLFPLRYKNQGEFFLDGNKPVDDWHGWIPMSQVPFIRNPKSGFVSSANQALTDSTYPYYISYSFGPPDRAQRINSLLSKMNHINVDSMRLMQNDSYSEMAASVLPIMLKKINRRNKDPYQKEIQQITNWDYRYNKESAGAVIFSAWWTKLYEAIWQDDFVDPELQLPWPSYEKTAVIVLRDSTSMWVDDIRTTEKEGINDIVNLAFRKAIDSLTKLYNTPKYNWNWGNYRSRHIKHIMDIPGMGTYKFSADGTANTINALTDEIGPSWRMVVELGKQPKGYGILPGGQSGNPGSIYYDNSLNYWKEGKLMELIFLKSKDQELQKIAYQITIKK